MRGKKGAAHFEMIISFVFFMGFILFLFVILKPYDTTTLSISVVPGLYDSFQDEVNTNLTSVFLKANNTDVGGCLSVGLPSNIFQYGFSNTLVRDIGGDEISSQMSGSNLRIDGESIFYKVLMSPEFGFDSLSGCASLDNYELGSLIEREVISYSSLLDMADEYELNYADLRERLDVPEVFDFAISSEEFPEANMETLIPSAGDVLARDYVLEVLESDGEITSTRFTLKIW